LVRPSLPRATGQGQMLMHGAMRYFAWTAIAALISLLAVISIF
jgi:hypothetical protein